MIGWQRLDLDPDINVTDGGKRRLEGRQRLSIGQTVSLKFRHGQVRDQANARQFRVMVHNQFAIVRAVHIQFDSVGSHGDGPPKSGQRVLQLVTGRTAVGQHTRRSFQHGAEYSAQRPTHALVTRPARR